MSTSHIGKENVGRIAERIVANELENQGFLVRDLNLEGLAANADLLAVKDGHVWLVQVKGTRYNEQYRNNGWWFQYGFCKQEHIADPNVPMFNRVPGSFRANIVALVCFRSPHEYQFIFLPVELAEEAAQLNLKYAFRGPRVNSHPNMEGVPLKPGIVYFTLYPTKARTPERQKGIDEEQKMLRPLLINRSWKVNRSDEVVHKQIAEEHANASALLNEAFKLRSRDIALTDTIATVDFEIELAEACIANSERNLDLLKEFEAADRQRLRE